MTDLRCRHGIINACEPCAYEMQHPHRIGSTGRLGGPYQGCPLCPDENSYSPLHESVADWFHEFAMKDGQYREPSFPDSSAGSLIRHLIAQVHQGQGHDVGVPVFNCRHQQCRALLVLSVAA